MLARRHMTGLILAILAGTMSSAADAGIGGTADQAEKAVTEFCLPVLNGGDAAALAAKLGITPNYQAGSVQQEWAARNTGDYYHYPTMTGQLILVVKSEKKQLSCDVALFNVLPTEGEAAFEQVDAYMQGRHYRAVKGIPQEGAKAYKAGPMLFILLGPQRGVAPGEPQMHVAMKRRLYEY
jgi:hypothetical protein